MHMFAFSNRTQANNAFLHAILLKWDNPKYVFRFGKKLLKFTPKEVAIVMGLGVEEEVIVNKRENLTVSTLRHKFFEKK